MENNKLQVILKEQDIDASDVQKLVKAFGGPFDEVGEILSKYKEVEVTDENDRVGMAKARELRLALKKARTTIENSRKDLKADIVKQGRAIDSVARLVKEEIEPAEQYLELQEKYAEIQEEKRAEEKARVEAQIKAQRIEELYTYTDDISLYNLDGMSNEQFDNLIAKLKAEKLRLETEAKKLEDERIAKEKAEREENERVRVENEKLRKEAEAKEAEQAKKDAEAKAEQDRIQKEADEKLAKERAEREKLEKEKAEREAEEKRKEEEAKKVEQNALLAPDKDKLFNLATGLSTVRTERLPALKTKKAQDVINEVDSKLKELVEYIVQQAKQL